MPKDTKTVILQLFLIISIILIVMASTQEVIKKLNNNYIIEGSACTENNDCINLKFDCFTRIQPKYEWAGDINCINNKCECVSR